MADQQESFFALARERLATARDVRELRKMLAETAPLYHQSLRRHHLRGERPDLALEVKSLDVGHSGMAVLGASRTHVFLNSSDGSTRRRYTLAHELCHALLASVDRQRLGLDHMAEERICDAFARDVLMPTPELRRYFATEGFPQSIDDLRHFCRAFKVGLTAAVKALASHHDAAWPIALIAARRRRQSDHSPQIALRVEAASTPGPVLAPYGKRLQSLGLVETLRWCRDVREPGAEGLGREPNVRLRSRQAGIAGWTGPAQWSAWTISEPRSRQDYAGVLALVLALDTSELRPLPALGARRAGVARRAGAKTGAGQERLDI
jgi:Zn-dependent peptidase ImmA (M78 family)